MRFAVCIGEHERNFLAGFLEGEASLVIAEQNGGQSFACLMTLNQRDDEQDMLEWLLASTGLGRLSRVKARRTSQPQVRWTVASREHCRELLALVEPYGFHGRRVAELTLWRRAVRAWIETGGDERRATLRALKAELAAARAYGGGAPSATPFAGRRQLLGYISGFVCAEGCFGFSSGRPRFSIHLRRDDRPLLELLAASTGLGKVTEHHPAALNPSATWTVAGRTQLAELRELLWRAGLPGRKAREMEAWGAAVDELNRAGGRPRRDRLEAARQRLSELRIYRPPERPELLRLPGRDLSAESLDALGAWSRSTTGKLSSTEYMRWRRDQPHAPPRSTVVRQFGSWHGALEAAGLGDRIARAPRRVGGEAGRRARRDAQRARLVAAVWRFEREHGRLPRALEFFRWRYERAIEAPSQGSVCRLFPGGWAEVLDETRQEAGATV